MSQQADLLGRAAQCESASQSATDPRRKQSLRLLRDLWVAIADESLSMSDAELAREIATMEAIHAATFDLGSTEAAE